MQGVMKSFEPSKAFDEKIYNQKCAWLKNHTGKSVQNPIPDGFYLFSGVTDASGATSLNSSDVIDNMIISLVKAN